MSEIVDRSEIRSVSPAELLGTLNEVEEKNAPSGLWVVGDVELLRTGARVSVVGSRKPSPEGLERARRYAHTLCELDVVVVSGLAEGIDRAAHEEALRAGGRTVAVLGSGLDRPYPASNRNLFGRIAAEHAAISQFAPGTPPRGKNFPQRNRVMALITDATIIVEAGESSGTRHQGWEALRLNRTLFIDRHVIEAGRSWAGEMLGYGAQVIDPEDLPHLMDELPTVSSGVAELPF